MAMKPAAVAVEGLSSLAYSEVGGELVARECEDNESEGLLALRNESGGVLPLAVLLGVGGAVSSPIIGRLRDAPRLGSAFVDKGESSPEPDEDEDAEGEYGKC